MGLSAVAAEDPECVERAFGRSTLGGQLEGSLARVYCPERSFSRFSEHLLECLDTSPLAREPVPLIDREAKDKARRAAALGLDEGATPIYAGEPGARALGRRVPPVVFSNVEPYMNSAQRQEPLPVLCLLRSDSARARGKLVAGDAATDQGLELFIDLDHRTIPPRVHARRYG